MLGIALFSAVNAIAAQIPLTTLPRTGALAIISLWVLVTMTIVWQFTGLWRSANRDTRLGGSVRWAQLAKGFVVFAGLQASSLFIHQAVPQALEFGNIALGQDSHASYQLRLHDKSAELEILGDIGFGLTSQVQDFLTAHPYIRQVRLNSAGGRIAEARRLSNLIESKNLSTVTTTGCYSACVIPFAAGKERVVAKEASLGFHQPAFPGLTANQLANEIEQDRAYLVAKGVNPEFVAKALSTPNTELWQPSHSELLGAGMVTVDIDSAVAGVISSIPDASDGAIL
jgi:hypothetical protein